MSEISAISVDLTSLHVRRSEFLDAYGQIELALTNLLRASGETNIAIPMAQRLQKFRMVKPCSHLAKSNVAKIPALADKIAETAAMRADIVHSIAMGIIVDGKPVMQLVNAQNSGEQPPQCRLFTESAFKRLSDKAIKLADEVAALRKSNPASSPPPP